MAGVYKGLTVKLGADTHELTAALNEIDSRTTKLKSGLRNAGKALKVDPGNMELVRQNYKYLGDQVREYESRLKELKAAESQIGKENMSTEAWDTLQREIAQTEAKLKSAREALRQFALEQAAQGSALGQAGAKLTELGEKLTPIGERMQSVGRTLTTHVTLPLAGVAAASVKTAVDVDTALTGVKKTVNATAGEYEALKESAIEYSKTHAVSATDILNAEELGGQLGVAKDNLEAFAKVVTGLDISTNMNVESASMNLAQFMNVTKASADTTKSAAEQYEAYGNAIVGLGNNLATTEADISNFSLRIASAASLAGMSQADILGIAGAMSSLGLQAEAGGTAFSNTITEISLAVSKGGDELEGFAAVAGKSAEEFAEKWRGSPTEAFIDFINGLAQGKDAGEDMNVILDELGITGIRQSDAMRRLAGDTDLLTESVKLANDEWRSGNALSAEVGNRNESLAAKFDMLRNRLAAVAEQIGVPLADALLGVIDAAEPLFQAIEDGARSFSEMSEGEQQAIVQTVALIACLGPALSLFGRAATSVTTMGAALTFLSRQQAAAGMAVEGFAKRSTAAQVAASRLAASQNAAAGAGKALAGASSLARAGLVGLVAGGVVYLATEIAKANDKLEKARAHQEDMVSSAGALRDSLSLAGAAASDAGGSADGLSTRLESLTRSGTEAAESFRSWAQTVGSANTGLHAATALTQDYEDTIASLLALDVEQGGLSPDQVAELNAAIEGLNKELGTSYSYLADHTGQLYDEAAGEYAARDAVLEHIDALQRERAESSYGDMYAEAQKKATELRVEQEGVIAQIGDLPDRIDRVRSAMEGIEAFNENYRQDSTWQDLARQLGDLEGVYNELQGQVEMYDGQIAESEKLSRAASEAMKLIELTGSDAGTALERAFAERIPAVVGAFAQSDQSMQDFVRTLESTGVGADKLAEVTDADLAEMARSYDGSLSSIATKLAEYGVDVDESVLRTEQMRQRAGSMFDALAAQAGGDLDEMSRALDALGAMGLDDKTLHVTDEGTIADEAGRVWDLNAQTIDGKHFTVNDDGTISIEGTNVDALDAKKVADKSFVITDQGTGQVAGAAADSVRGKVLDIPSSKLVRIDAQDNATSVIDRIRSAVSSLAGGVFSVIAGRASGGITSAPIRIPRHADGGLAGIATSAILTNVGFVGEAGAEAIVPLTNRRYVRPFARAVASEMPSGSQVDPALVREAVALLGQIRDKDAGLYIDGRELSRATAPSYDKALAREAGWARMGARR